MLLPVPDQSNAVLIGAANYRSTSLEDLDAIHNNVIQLAATLTDPNSGGFAADRCATLLNPIDIRSVYEVLTKAAKEASHTLLVYYAGHGLLDMKNELHLALAETDPSHSEVEISALPIRIVKQVLANAKATHGVLILDCCFSGRATDPFMSSPSDFVVAQADFGGVIIASAPRNLPALAPPGDPYTAFTGELIWQLHDSLSPGAHPRPLDILFRRIVEASEAKKMPRPQMRGTPPTSDLTLTRLALEPDPKVPNADDHVTNLQDGAKLGPPAKEERSLAGGSALLPERRLSSAEASFSVFWAAIIVASIGFFYSYLTAGSMELYYYGRLYSDSHPNALDWYGPFGGTWIQLGMDHLSVTLSGPVSFIVGISGSAVMGLVASLKFGFDGEGIHAKKLIAIDLIAAVFLVVSYTLGGALRLGVTCGIQAVSVFAIAALPIIYVRHLQSIARTPGARKRKKPPTNVRHVTSLAIKGDVGIIGCLAIGGVLGIGLNVIFSVGCGNGQVPGLMVGSGVIAGLAGVLAAVNSRWQRLFSDRRRNSGVSHSP
jgi:hypothetical protein